MRTPKMIAQRHYKLFLKCLHDNTFKNIYNVLKTYKLSQATYKRLAAFLMICCLYDYSNTVIRDEGLYRY